MHDRTAPARATHQFAATIEAGRRGGALVRIPFDVREEFGTRGQVKVHATFDGAAYRGSLAPAQWVAEAKRQETRDRRAARTVKRLAGGVEGGRP